MVRTSAARWPRKHALHMDGRVRTYGDLTDQMGRIAAWTQAQGLSRGDIVALIAPNCLEYIEIVLGLSEQGITVATLNPGLGLGELEQILEDCTPSLLLVHDDLAAHRRLTERTVLFPSRLSEELEQLAPVATIPSVDEKVDFAVTYTSGTTGRPKGVLLSHRSRSLTIRAMATEYGCYGPDDHFLSITPLFHGAGFAFAVAALASGGSLTLLAGPNPEMILATLAQQDITGIFVVPTILQRIFSCEEEVLDRYKGRHGLSAIISNAAALAPGLKQQTVDYFGEGLLHETYGSTEAGIVTNMRPSAILQKPNSVGTAFIETEIELRRDDGALANVGETGELFSRAAYAFSGYLNRPDATTETMQGGWISVGDLAVKDPDGYFEIIGRKKDMVVTGGVNVYPREIELVAEQMPGVLECAVVGIPDAEWGEKLCATYVAEPGITLLPGELLAFCRDKLSSIKTPKLAFEIDSLPRNVSGKILKKELREIAKEHLGG